MVWSLDLEYTNLDEMHVGYKWIYSYVYNTHVYSLYYVEMYFVVNILALHFVFAFRICGMVGAMITVFAGSIPVRCMLLCVLTDTSDTHKRSVYPG